MAPSRHDESEEERLVDAWRALDRRHLVHPFSDPTTKGRDGGRIITHGAGIFLWDAEGRRILDGTSGLWNATLGYGRKDLAAAAATQLAVLPACNIFSNNATPPAILLAAKLAALAPRGLEHVFFTNSGSEANETVIRLVRHFWNLVGKPAKKTFIGLEFGYHGSTLASASLGAIAPLHAQGDLPLAGFAYIPSPYWFRDGGTLTEEAFGYEAAAALAAKIHELGAENVAAFIGEPVQGAGGVIIPPASYWSEIARICQANDVLFVLDELVTGFGRLGHWFGCAHFGVAPDLMTVGKGLAAGYQPVAAVLVGARIAGALAEKSGDLNHGFTTSGHPVACATALAALDAIEREGIVARVREEIGPYFQAKLAELAGHPLVGEARGLGLIGAVELVADKRTRRRFSPEGLAGAACRDIALGHGLAVRAARDTLLLAPALIISKDEVDELMTLVRRALDETAAMLSRATASR